jgi:hypothetical protein
MMVSNMSQKYIGDGRNMKYLSFVYLGVVACVSLFFLLVLNFNPPERRNICNVAEISPDVTQKEREECRMIRGHKL